MEKYYLFYFLALIAEILGTVSGFGSSLLFVPIAAMFFDFKMVLGITAVFHVFSNLSKIALFRKGIDKRIVLKLGIPAVVFVIIGALLSSLVPQKELEFLMFVFLIIVSVLLLLFSDKKIENSNRNLVTSGIFSGFLAGLIGSGGAIRGLTLTAFQIQKDAFIATSAIIDMGVDVSRTVVYFFNGYIVKEYLFLLPFLIVISIVGSWIGKKILKYVSEKIFRYIVLFVVILTSVFQTVKYVVEY